ncbi:MAG: hypothetical protein Q9N02_07870 [Ghiorsea sp.]|nr:hypothetical protein [Ghiorsea sp.]
MKKKLSQYSLAALLSLSFNTLAYADDWSGYTDVSWLTGAYSGNTTRTAVNAYGASMNVDYLERAGVKVAGSQLNLTDNGNLITQQSAFVSAYMNYFCDTFGGVFKFRLDAHQANLSDNFTYKDSVRAYAPQVSFLNYQKNFYLDLGYSVSTYDLGLEAKQYTPTLGFAFNQGSDWLQMRGYLIDTKRTGRGIVSSTQAVELKLTHWTAAPSSLFSQLFANALVGERMLAVDGDAASIYSLVDKQQGGGAIGAAWQSHYVDGMVMLSIDKYLNRASNATYTNSLAYISVSKSW